MGVHERTQYMSQLAGASRMGSTSSAVGPPPPRIRPRALAATRPTHDFGSQRLARLAPGKAPPTPGTPRATQRAVQEHIDRGTYLVIRHTGNISYLVVNECPEQAA